MGGSPRSFVCSWPFGLHVQAAVDTPDLPGDVGGDLFFDGQVRDVQVVAGWRGVVSMMVV
jgi:hypothetical protein